MTTTEKIYKASIVNQVKGKKPFWNGVGRAFKSTTEDGRECFNVPSLNLVILEVKPEEDKPENAQVETLTEGVEA